MPFKLGPSGAGDGDFVFALASCAACGVGISFDPHRVPSLRDSNNVKRPICLRCFHEWNRIHRTDKGLEPVPLPEGAYMGLGAGDV